MAEKDIAEKILESYNDVFADIVNVLLFDGEEVLKPDELLDQAPRSAYKADGRLREMERDVAKRWTNQNIRIACVGLENQTAVDPDMPLRVIAYDGMEYRAELNSGEPERYPVVTLTLYFGFKKRWDRPTNLLGCLTVPEKFTPYVNDYRLNLFEIAYLSDEQLNLFKSDFGIVAKYFSKLRKGETDSYQELKIKLDHALETLQLLSVMANDKRFEIVCYDKEKGVPEDLCEALDRIENRGVAAGADMIVTLMRKLFEAGRVADAEKASKDEKYRRELLKEFGLSKETMIPKQ